jgi:hypothetical protein
MPSSVRIGIYAFGLSVIGLIAAILAANGSWTAAAAAALSASIHLMSAIMTWRRRGWTPDEPSEPEEPGGLGTP